MCLVSVVCISKIQDSLGDEHSSNLFEPSSNFSVINWPPRSKYLNPIEYLWNILEKGESTSVILTELEATQIDVWQSQVCGTFSQTY